MGDGSMINATYSSTNAIGMIEPVAFGWIVTIIVFVLIIATLFLVSRNIRATFYGAIVTGALGGIFKLSRMTGKMAEAGNTGVFKGILGVVAFLFVSYFIGKFIMQTKWFKKLNLEG